MKVVESILMVHRSQDLECNLFNILSIQLGLSLILKTWENAGDTGNYLWILLL